MKKKLIISLSTIIMIFMCSSCSLFDFSVKIPSYEVTYSENKKILNIPSLEKKNKDFNSCTVTDTLTFNFSNSIGVESTKYYAPTNGTYSFKSHSGQSGIKMLVHTGSIINDEFKSVPFSIDLKSGYEYSIEMTISNGDLVNKDIIIDVDRPDISSTSKDISYLTSFTESNKSKGEILTYYFTARASGLHRLETSGVYGIEAYRPNSSGQQSRFDYTYQDNFSFICNEGERIMLEVKSSTEKNPGKISFTFHQPLQNCKLNDFDKTCVYYITFEVSYRLQTQYFHLIAPESGHYYFETIIPSSDLGLGECSDLSFDLEKCTGSANYKRENIGDFRYFKFEAGQKYGFTCQFTSDDLKNLKSPQRVCIVFCLSSLMTITEK